MVVKPIKVITGMNCWDTKIYEGEELINEKIGNIFGIDIKIRVDAPPKMTIHRYNTEMKYVSSAPHKLVIINHEPKEKDNGHVLENTSFDNAKNGKNYIKKQKKKGE